MKPTNRFYAGSPPDPGDLSPLIRCKCQRLNTLEDYRSNDGECPGCGERYKPADSED